MSDMEITRITITRVLTEEGGDMISVEAHDQNGELPGLVEMLGMVEMARDTVYRMAAGDVDEPDDEDEEHGHDVH